MKRFITTASDPYGLDTDGLRARLLAITGSEEAADDSLAAVAEWLDAMKPDVIQLLRAEGHSDSEQIGAGDAITALAMDVEGRVSDSVYGLSYATFAGDGDRSAAGSPKRRRMLKNSPEVWERLQHQHEPL